jgi:hypothetical protein
VFQTVPLDQLSQKKRLTNDFLGAKPPNPLGRLCRRLDQQTFCEAEQTLFASFSGKRRIQSDQLVGFAEGWANNPSAKQHKRFLLLFLEKEEYNQTNWSALLRVGPTTFLRSRTNALASFLEKKSMTNAIPLFSRSTFWRMSALGPMEGTELCMEDHRTASRTITYI